MTELTIFAGMRYFTIFQYDGSKYHGWQRQPNAYTVQEVMEEGFSKLLKTELSLVASGRTDTGVHAKKQVAHFDLAKSIDPKELKFKLNSYLPKSIAIRSIRAVQPEAHARFDAISRAYRYYIHAEKDVFTFRHSYYFKPKLDLALMDKACQRFREQEDFTSFSKVHTDVNHYRCKIFEAHWEQFNDSLVFYVKANRFLRGMVRAMVGTLLAIGTNKLTLQDLDTIFEAKDRRKAGISVPGHALFLEEVNYPDELFLED